MSNLVFPIALPGAQINLKRKPSYATSIQTASSGAELRASWQTYPRYKYTLSIEFLRSAAVYAEFQRVMSAIEQVAGSYDTFLVVDPEDCRVSNHGFAVTDGGSTAYQLQRTLGGVRQSGLWNPATYPVSSTPRTNLCISSQDVTAWQANASGTGISPTVTANYSQAPDGSKTASRAILNSGAGTTLSDFSQVYQPATSLLAGVTYTSSVWMRINDGTTRVVRLSSFASDANVTVTPVWQRFSISGDGGGTSGYVNPILRGTFGTASFADLSVWGGQIERGPLPTEYIPTTTDAVTVRPSYWPQLGDGFVPVVDVNPASVALFLDGTLQTPGVDYNYTGSGIVTFTSTPAANLPLTWSGFYFRRVRFADDEIEFERIFDALWQGQSVELISVK